jgi:hypothetical protein
MQVPTVHRRLLIPLLAAFALGASAQIDVSVTLEQQQFLPGETLDASVRIANFTGGPLKLGAWPGWLSFTVEAGDGTVVARKGEMPDSGDFTLENATAGTIKFNIAPQFVLDRPGIFKVTATVSPKPGGDAFTSAPVNFDIISGSRLEERVFGHLLPDGTTERRKFILQQANYLKELRLYLRVSDDIETKTFKVTSLGTTVNFNRPEFLLDRHNHFHVLHQFGSVEYRYHEFAPDGSLLARELWAVAASRPKLKVNADGDVAVVGGVRRLSKSDVPAPSDEDLAKVREAELAQQRALLQALAATNAPANKKSKSPPQ